MKKFFCLMLLSLLSFATSASVLIDGLYYDLDYTNKTAAVVGYIETGKPVSVIYVGNIVIPESVKYNNENYRVTAIDDSAFNGCNDMTSITIPNSVISIGEMAFNTCHGITSIKIPNSVTSIGWAAFSATPNVTSIVVEAGNSVYDSRDNCNAIIETSTNKLIAGCNNTSIPNDIASIDDWALIGCKNLQSIAIPQSVTYMGKQAFSGCTSLSDVYCYTDKVPSGFSDCFGYEGDNFINNCVLHAHDYTIEDFKKLSMEFKDIVVFEKVTDFNLTYYVDGTTYKTEQHKYDDEITPEAEPTRKGMKFSGWSEIPEKMLGKDVDVTGTFTWAKDTIGGVIYEVADTINNNAAVIGNDKASGEVKIVSPVKFDYDYSIADIVDFSFKNNTEITSVVIPESVMKIGDEAFYGCKNLTKIELGKSVNQIEPRAFAGIDKLTDVICYAEDLVPDADRTAFENSYTEDYVTLHVPAGSVEKYKAVAPWKNFKEIVAIEEEEKDVEGETITLKDSGKGTWCSENDLDFTDLEDIKAYIASGYDDIKKTIWLTRVYSVPAGTGIMVKGTPGEHKIPYAKVRAYYANMFKGVVGSAEKIEATDGDWTNYYMAGGQFKIVNSSTTISPNRAYLQLPTLVFAGTRSVDVVYEDEIDDKTGINPNFISNDQEPADIYNLQGQRVENPRKGLYIRKGKKVVIK